MGKTPVKSDDGAPQVQDQAGNNTADEKRMHRSRKKRFYTAIREQVEFYLGDVNLSRDRLFSNLLREDGFVHVNMILKCNKIKKLTDDRVDIVKALAKSQLLKVDETGTKISRSVPIAEVKNPDQNTIYVENLPPEIDHEWLKSVFECYGKVEYVSIPRFTHDRSIKGFAFVQFDSPESSLKAIEAFLSVNACLSSTIQPECLRSIVTFEGANNEVDCSNELGNVTLKMEGVEVKCEANSTEADQEDNQNVSPQITNPAQELGRFH